MATSEAGVENQMEMAKTEIPMYRVRDTQASKRTLTLLDLPADITCIIWKYVLATGKEAEKEVKYCKCLEETRSPELSFEDPEYCTYAFGMDCSKNDLPECMNNLLLVNRRIYQEAFKYATRDKVLLVCGMLDTCLLKFIRLMMVGHHEWTRVFRHYKKLRIGSLWRVGNGRWQYRGRKQCTVDGEMVDVVMKGQLIKDAGRVTDVTQYRLQYFKRRRSERIEELRKRVRTPE